MFKVLRIRLSALLLFTGAFLSVGACVAKALCTEEQPEGTALPVIMYHGVTKDSSKAGEYVITSEELEGDFRYISEQGYTPVFAYEAADFVYGEAEGDFPEKPIIITFDDGCYNNFCYVLPLLEKYRIKAVFSVTGKWCAEAGEAAQPDPAYSTMDTENLKTLVYSGYCEIANHSYDMHCLDSRRGMLMADGESVREYRVSLLNDLTRAQRILEESGRLPTTLAYPYGYYTDISEQVCGQLGINATFSCEEKINYISQGDYSCLRCMGRFNRSGLESREEFFDKIKRSGQRS